MSTFYGAFLKQNPAVQTSLTMRNEYSRQCFAFIVNVKCLPDPFLVEISRGTKTQQRTVEAQCVVLTKTNGAHSPRNT
jgi:hypothetical protein